MAVRMSAYELIARDLAPSMLWKWLSHPQPV